jgi:hypothetical protein
MTDFDSMFRNLPKEANKTQVGLLLTATAPSAPVVSCDRPVERTETETVAPTMVIRSRAQKSPAEITFDWIPLEPSVSASGQRAARRRRVSPIVRKTGALSALFFALHTVMAQIEVKSILIRLNLDAIPLAAKASEARQHVTIIENSDPSTGTALTWAPQLSDRTQGLISESLKTDAVRTEASQALLGSNLNVEPANAEASFPSPQLTVARYYRQPDNGTLDDPAPPSVVPQTAAPATPPTAQSVPLIRPVQLENGPEPIRRSDWEIQKSKGNRRPVVDKAGVVEIPREKLPGVKPSDVTPRALNTVDNGRRSNAGKTSTVNGNASAVIDVASGSENGRSAPRADERAHPDLPMLERIEQVPGIEKKLQQRSANGRTQKPRSQGQARTQLVAADWSSRRSSLGSSGRYERRDQADAPTHLTVLGMRIPTLKPVWADDVFNKATR